MNRSAARWQHVASLYESVVDGMRRCARRCSPRRVRATRTCDPRWSRCFVRTYRVSSWIGLLWATAASLLDDGLEVGPGHPLGPYRIERALGSGGMGEVFRAVDTRLDRTVAIKVLPTDVARDEHMRARFAREARAIAALTHPHICTLYDVGRHDEVDFLVMEYSKATRWPSDSRPGDCRWKRRSGMCDPDCQCARSRARPRDCAPGPEARQRDAHGGRREAARFRTGEVPAGIAGASLPEER